MDSAWWGYTADYCPSVFTSLIWCSMTQKVQFFRAAETHNSTLAATCIPTLLCVCMKCLYRMYQSQKGSMAYFLTVQKYFLIILDNRKVTWGLTASVSCLDRRNEKCTHMIKNTLARAAVSWLHTLTVPRAPTADAWNKLVFVLFNAGSFSSHRRFAVNDLAKKEERCKGGLGLKEKGIKARAPKAN